MNKMQEYLLRAGNDLELRVVAPFQLQLNSGKKVIAEAVFPDLGAPKGMIIVQREHDISGSEDELIKSGYGYSVFDGPLASQEYDVEPYRKMFIDWGWSGEKERKPNWMD